MKELIKAIVCSIGRMLGANCQQEIPMPTPIPKPIGTIDLHLMSSILLDKLEEMACDAEIYLPDEDCKIYRKADVQNCAKLKEISELKYIPKEHDCDDFAAESFGAYLGLLWTMVHAQNWFVDENEVLWFVEPQTQELARNLSKHLSSRIRFFLGR